jgi:hypothetical protein
MKNYSSIILILLLTFWSKSVISQTNNESKNNAIRMNNIRIAIAKYNQTNAGIFPDMADYNKLIDLPKANDESIKSLENLQSTDLPSELESFYKTFGGLVNKDNDESYCFNLPTIEQFISKMKSNDSNKLKSIGIIDMVNSSWGNGRAELNDGKHLTEDQTKFLNENYKCIGWYRDDTILESAYYIYYDKKGSFGEVFYDQDEFDGFKKELNHLLNKNNEQKTLEQILTKALEQTRLTMIEWN